MMKSQQPKQQKELESTQYQAPAIIYTGKISTRAGTGGPVGEPNNSVVDPADLFGND